jgi:transposase
MKKTRTKKKTESKRKKGQMVQLPELRARAAGIDIGSEEIFVAVPPTFDPEPVRKFGAFTADLLQIAEWLLAHQITTVAMESTGVYWIPLYDVLEERGIEVYLVNAAHAKNVPGRSTDVSDCQWLQFLHSVGLLRDSFHPAQQIRALRDVRRHRENLVAMAAEHILHMQKALDLMNLQLHRVISDLTGVTGMSIVQAILDGERDSKKLALLRDPNIRATPEIIEKSLTGNYQQQHLFILKQALDAYRYYQRQIFDCDEVIKQLISKLPSKIDPQEHPIPPARNRHKKRQGNEYHFDMRGEMYRVYGVDLTQVPSIGTSLVAALYTEIGENLKTDFPAASNFSSWMGFCPAHEISGGKVLSRKTRKVPSRLAQAFRMCAQALNKSQSALGDYYRRMRARLGAPKAITAAAHKLARIVYHMVTTREPYKESIFEQLDEARLKQQKAKLVRQARKMGFLLTPITPTTSAVVP